MANELNLDRKRAWIVPTAEVFASQSDVAAQVGADIDEDFTGIS